MKSYSHLYEKYATEDNVVLAIKNLCKHKKKSKVYYSRVLGKRITIRDLRDHAKEYAPKFLEYATHFYNYKHVPKVIYDGISRKKRTIIVPSIDEQVVHHMIVNILKPIFLKSMYYNSFGSIPGKGPYKGKQHVEKFIRKMKPGEDWLCWKLDIRRFFESIDHGVLKKKLTELIHDFRFLMILYIVIDAVACGLPLGLYTSQWIGNWFLTCVDHLLKDRLGVPGDFRYMDDMDLFSKSKRQMHEIFTYLTLFLSAIKLELKSTYHLFHFDDGTKRTCFLDFMGFRFYRNRTTLRRKTMIKMTRLSRRLYKKHGINSHDAKQMLSGLGRIKACNIYGMYKDRIKPFTSFGKLKRRVSKSDRRMNNELCVA